MTLKQIADHEFLLDCFKELRREGGWGAGGDSLTFTSLSPTDWANAIRDLSKALLRSRYRPINARQVPIPKPGTDEKRNLRIGSISDRVVAKALETRLSPHLDKLFLDGSWGFRKGRGTHEMLADLKARIEQSGRSVLVIEDVRKAFDNVVVDDLLESHKKAQSQLANDCHDSPVKINDSVLKLIATIAKDTDQRREIGIDQGNNYSPTALNVMLHYVHDVPLSAVVEHPFWYRYVDNLTYLCQSESEGHEVLNQVQQLLENSRLELKETGGGIIDLCESPAILLGFSLQLENGNVCFTLTELAWKELKQRLVDAHDAINPTKAALEVILGWANAFGLAFKDDGSTIVKVLNVAYQCGFLELDRDLINEVADKAKTRWHKVVESSNA